MLSSGFKERSQDELIKELQDHVTYNTGAWMCPKKVIQSQDNDVKIRMLIISLLVSPAGRNRDPGNEVEI